MSSGTIVTAMGVAAAMDPAAIVTKITGLNEANTLPPGSVVGDVHGGLTFSDPVAAVLENRSKSGWKEVQMKDGQIWTIIILDQ